MSSVTRPKSNVARMRVPMASITESNLAYTFHVFSSVAYKDYLPNANVLPFLNHSTFRLGSLAGTTFALRFML